MKVALPYHLIALNVSNVGQQSKLEVGLKISFCVDQEEIKLKVILSFQRLKENH